MTRYLRLKIFLTFFASFSPLSFVGAKVSPKHLRRQYDKGEIKVDKSKHDKQFFTFVTRPDLVAPRWNLKVHNEDALAPGYWFTTAYGAVEQNNNNQDFVGPYIYDSRGELVWSGSEQLHHYNTFDLRVSKHNGKNVLSMVYIHDNAGLLMDSSYKIVESLPMGQYLGYNVDANASNLHDLQIMNDTYMIMTRRQKEYGRKEMAKLRYDGKCIVALGGFKEIDLATHKTVFEWKPENHLSLSESDVQVQDCDGLGWDYIHPNSIDKLPDGNYIMSGRHSNAIYKISRQDASIMWRFGGKHSDFKWIDDGHFLGQHHARFYSQNETHLLITLLDNANGPFLLKENNDCSRGLIIALRIDVKPMTAQIVQHFDHPQRGFATSRGSMQMLPNGNAFVGFADSAFHSEHTPDGKCIMEAEMPSGLKAYRSYKFPWIGRPEQRPDVVSSAIEKNGSIVTTAWVSWNGATEVRKWNMYKTTKDGGYAELVASVLRDGFETALTYHQGYASYVMLVATDRDGNKLGKSHVVKTNEPHDLTAPEVVAEAQWLAHHSDINSVKSLILNGPSIDWLLLALGIMIGVFVVGCVYMFRRKSSGAWWQRSHVYELVPQKNLD